MPKSLEPNQPHASNLKWQVHKFGGTSVFNAERFRGVFRILTELLPIGRKAVVVSAMKGTTDDLLKAVELAKQHQDYKAILKRIQLRHETEASELLGEGSALQDLLTRLRQDFHELEEILRGVWLVKGASDGIRDLVSGLGEVWSAQILCAYAQSQGLNSTWLDARQVLVVETSMGRVVVDWLRTREKFASWQKGMAQDFVTITGFVAATVDGTVTTLGRNGSDYSGSIFGALFDCDEVMIWTDVDGVLSADPRLVPEAVILDEMTYSEVSELAYFGAKVVHPATMTPLIEKQIPIWIKNTLNPNAPGTKIHKNAKSDRAVKGFSTIENMALVSVEGAGMVGIPGVAERLFGALRAAEVNVVLISQASSEHSICFAITESQAATAEKAVRNSFHHEFQNNIIQTIAITRGVSILAAVGDNMARTPGISGRFFTALGQSGVNVRAIAQGSSERNISAVIDTLSATKALRTVHSSFILPHLSLSIGVIGAGSIGGTFLDQLSRQGQQLRTKRKIDIQIRAISDSKRMYLSDQPIALDRWRDDFAKHAEPLDVEKFTQHVRDSHLPHAGLIEATASAELSRHYPNWLRSGLHIISPNKKANTGSMQDYLEIRRATQSSGRHFLYATNVGAGLPILQTLRDLHATGDEIQLIQGVFSGTLSYLFNSYNGERRFSEIVLEAKAKGYTEPDPRDDLSGEDVKRKLVILARELGFKTELSDVTVDGLVPAHLQDVSSHEFLKRLPELDEVMGERLKHAHSAGQVLRFTGTLNHLGQARVGLEALPKNHAFSHITGTDNIVLFQTARYLTQPLVVQGPGAGPDVTAAGVFADLLRLAQYLGAGS